LMRFQLTVRQLMLATRPANTCCFRTPCLSAAPDSSMHGFGTWVATAFLETRAAHRKRYDSSEVCAEPEYEVLSVDAVSNPDLAKKHSLFIQCAEAREPLSTHEYRALNVASVRDSMKLHDLDASRGSAGVVEEGFNEGVLLGWHGASDEVVEDIVNDGFNPLCVGEGAGSLFGKGIYFAENSSKADLYAGPPGAKFKKCSAPMSVNLAVVYCGNMYEAKAKGAWSKAPLPTDPQIKAARIRRCAAKRFLRVGRVGGGGGSQAPGSQWGDSRFRGEPRG
jgi:hypothetical protein